MKTSDKPAIRANAKSISKASRYPTRINLKDLADEGENFSFSRTTGELNSVLKELIQAHDYTVEIQLLPMGNAYGISGHIHTEADLTCARCGRDMVNPIDDQFNELIVVMDEKPKGGHSGHTGGQFDDGPYCNYVTTHDFDMGEFVREHIAASEPYAPKCGRNDCETFLLKAQNQLIEPKADPSTPFDILKNLKLKN